MSKPVPKPFTPLLPTLPARPAARWHKPASTTNLIRDQLPISTWLLLGAALQTPLYLLLGRLALAPAILLLSYRILDAYAQATGWKRNTYLTDVIPGKFSTAFPDAEGDYDSQPSREGIVVLLIGTRCNHPLGMFAPGFQQSGEYFARMAKDLDAHADEFGFLGMSSYLNTNDRTSCNEILSVGYFRTTAGLHAFAHSEYHRDAWNWWNKNVKSHPHLSIYHEVYEAPRGHWENIYINSNPTMASATVSKVVDEEGVERWASPVVDASRGLLKTSRGRMSQGRGDEHEGYAFHDVYEN